MKKFFSLVAAVLFAGSMMAAEVVYKQTVFNATNNSEEIAGYENTWSNTTDGFKVNIVNANNNKNQWTYIKMGRKNVASVGSIATDAAIDKAVNKVVVTIDALTASKINSLKLYLSSNGSTWTAEETEFEKKAGAQTVAVASEHQAANLYYKIEADCASGSSNGLITISKVEFIVDVAGAPEAPTFSVAGGTYVEAQSVELACATEGAKIHYTLDGTDPTAASAEYSAALTISETTTVKAIAINNGVSSSVVSATYTIVATEGAGTQDDPFTVADVYLLNNGMVGKYWVVGDIVGCAGNGGTIGDDVKSNIALGDAVDQTENLAAVELKDSVIRANINIVDNPSNKGAQVKVYGNLVAYFGAPGIKNVTDYEILGGVTPVEPTDTVQITLTSDIYLNDQTGSQGWWLVEAYGDDCELVLSNAGLIDHVDGTYTAAQLDPEYSYLLTETDSINFVSGSITLATSAEGVFTVIGTLVGTDNIAYEISLTKTPAAHIDMTFDFAEDADGITITPSLDTELWDYYIISASAFATTWGNDADALAEAYATQIGTQYAMTGAEDLVFANLLSYYGAGDFVVLAFGISDAGVTTDVATYAFTLSEAGEGIEEILATGKAVKVVRDGQVVVLKADKAFNMNGQIVK